MDAEVLFANNWEHKHEQVALSKHASLPVIARVPSGAFSAFVFEKRDASHTWDYLDVADMV